MAAGGASVILRRSVEIVYFANTSRPLPRVTRPSSVSVSPRFRSRPRLLAHLSRCVRVRPDVKRDRGKERKRERAQEGQEATARKREKRVEKSGKEKRNTSDRSEAHLARGSDSPRPRPLAAPSNSRVRPARHSSRANPAKVTVLNRDCG